MGRSARAMPGSLQDRLLQTLSVLCVTAPFAFAFIRAVTTGGRDLRYVWVALAGAGGAGAVVLVARQLRSRRKAAIALSAGVFALASLFAVAAALLLGTRLGAGILVVGPAFGVCFAAGCLLHFLRRG
jgi:hypothetical protein